MISHLLVVVHVFTENTTFHYNEGVTEDIDMTSHHEKVRLTVECSLEERMYIKMLAAKRHMTISELLLSSFRKLMPCVQGNEPNSETIKALRESRESELESYKTLDDFWKAMEIDPNA